MRQLRIIAFAMISFVAALLGALLSPSTWLHKSLAVALCGVLSANPALCTNNAIAVHSQEASATNPVKVETTQFSDLLAQRSRDFDDDTPKSPPRQNPNNPKPPSFPNEVSPDFPVRSPDFDNRSSGLQNITTQNTRSVIIESSIAGVQKRLLLDSSDLENPRIVEIEYNNISLKDNPQIKSFKIYFGNEFDRISLSDGTNAVITSNVLNLTLPNGKSHSIPIPKNSANSNSNLDLLFSNNSKSKTISLDQKSFYQSNKIAFSEEECIQYYIKDFQIKENRIKAFLAAITAIIAFSFEAPPVALGLSLMVIAANYAYEEAKLQTNVAEKSARQICINKNNNNEKTGVCGQTQIQNGGQGTFSQTFNMGTNNGVATIFYEMCPNPDQMDIFYEGKVIQTTGGLVSGAGKLTAKFEGNSNNINVTMKAPNNGTGWAYVVYCPRQQIPNNIGKLRECK